MPKKPTKKNSKVIVLISGGVDSVTALYQMRQTYKWVRAISFDYGSKHNHKELPLAQLHCKRLKVPLEVISLPFVANLFTSSLLVSGGIIPNGHYKSSKMRQTVVPFRNGIFLAIAGGYAESICADAVVVGAHAGDHPIYPDCRPEFMEAMERALGLGTYRRVKIINPFTGKTKSDIVKVGHNLKVDFSKTWSCYKGEAVHCGICGTCVERREAFVLANVPDPTVYFKRLNSRKSSKRESP